MTTKTTTMKKKDPTKERTELRKAQPDLGIEASPRRPMSATGTAATTRGRGEAKEISTTAMVRKRNKKNQHSETHMQNHQGEVANK